MPQPRASWPISVRASVPAGTLAASLTLAALAVAACGHGATGPLPSGRSADVAGTVVTTGPVPGVRLIASRDALAACELRIERAPGGTPPPVAVVGASVTAGAGPDDPRLSWAVLLAGELRRDAVIAGISGTGYVRTGVGGLGPAARLLAMERLRALRPSLVIIQAGHDDSNVPAAVERQQVARTIALISGRAPQARIALLTVFVTAGQPVSAALYRTDHAIVAAGRAAGPGVIILDPLAGRWRFPRASDGLHPTAAGDAWIARKVAAIARANGVPPAPQPASTPVICDYSVTAGQR